MDKNEKLMQIFQDEQFLAESACMESAEDLQELLSKHGLDLTLDEVYGLCAQIACHMKGDELDEDDLEYVSGGVAVWLIVGCVAVGVAAIGSFAAGVYNGYKETRKK